MSEVVDRGGAPLRRSRSDRVLGGLCAGIAAAAGVSPLLVRFAFVAGAMAGGIGVVAYALGCVVVPAGGGDAGPRRTGSRGSIEIAMGTGLLLLSALLAFREAGIWFSDAVVWPLVLVASGAAVLWGRSSPAAPAPAPAEPELPAARVKRRAALVSRTSLGVALVICAGLVFLATTGTLTAARDVVVAVLVAVIVLGVIFAPWIFRLARSLGAERAERVRGQERAEISAHLHDSVLQTLAMVQKRADEPREVAALARRQERELRAWLSGRHEDAGAATGLASGLERAAAEVEDVHRIPVEVVVVGDRSLGDSGPEALLGAAREAMVNAAKFGDGSPVAVYAELDDERAQVFVRDRGPGFDLTAVPQDRRGISESIVGRMERGGGGAYVRSGPGEGTEVELVLGR